MSTVVDLQIVVDEKGQLQQLIIHVGQVELGGGQRSFRSSRRRGAGGGAGEAQLPGQVTVDGGRRPGARRVEDEQGEGEMVAGVGTHQGHHALVPGREEGHLQVGLRLHHQVVAELQGALAAAAFALQLAQHTAKGVLLRGNCRRPGGQIHQGIGVIGVVVVRHGGSGSGGGGGWNAVSVASERRRYFVVDAAAAASAAAVIEEDRIGRQEHLW